MGIFKKAIVVFLLTASLSMTAVAGSTTVPYQGLLRNAAGSLVSDGNYAMVFSIWNAVTAGTQVWTENHPVVAVKDGAFLVQLGETTALGTVFITHGNTWLQFAADTGSGSEVYATRVPLTSVPYAKQAENATSATNATNAGNADTLDSLHALAFAAASHTHDAANITSGTISMDRYSAYADLGAEGKIGAASTQVAAGNHSHPSLPFFIGWVGMELGGLKSLNTQEVSGITNTGTALVAPVAGRYLVHYRQLTATSATQPTYLAMNQNGNNLAHAYLNPARQEDMIITRIVDMAAGDQITFSVNSYVQAAAWGIPHSTITMYLIG
jgi:hypothetical protein